MTKNYAKKLAQKGLSIIPCKDNKVPIEKGWQKLPIKTSEEIEKLNCSLFGLRCGWSDVECIDVDTKVLVSLQERNDWWNEYINFLCDNIEDFMNKVVIAKTRGGGYHIIYKCKTISGNTKIARLEGMTEAIIETRGEGGQVILYDYFVGEREYHHIDYISESDREIIWSISKTYNWVDPIVVKIPSKKEFPIVEGEITPWDDYNNKVNILDLINDDFTIVRNATKQYVIKRHGAKSPHSGYIFKDSGCMYLFSTGTLYPAEELLSPFSVYTYKYHNGDFHLSTSEIYKDGFGSRRVPKIKVSENLISKKEDKEKIERVEFPVEIFPKEIQQFILESERTLGMSVDYMGSALIWITSIIIGNSIAVKVKSGWVEPATVWLALVGKAGIGKTPSINQMIRPIQQLNIREQKEYQKQMVKYMEFTALDKKEKQYAEEIDQPVSKQFIVGDITLEALVDLHEANPNAVGVFKDELAGWFKDMNKYRAGSDLEFWLSSWNSQPISLNRKTAKSAFVDKPFIPVLGGIQPAIFEELTNGPNKENGFLDRILITYPELKVNHYSDSSMDDELLEWYDSSIVKFKESIYNLCFSTNNYGDIDRKLATFSKDANTEWVRIHDKIVDLQNSDFENEYMKSMYPKQKSYVPRFALLLNVMWAHFTDEAPHLVIQKDNMLRAEKLSEYFVSMAKLVKSDSKEKHELRKATMLANTPHEKFKIMFEADPEINRSTVSELLEVSRRTVQRWVDKLEKK
jgi:hypothetical protein